jgi:hypothetical protein
MTSVGHVTVGKDAHSVDTVVTLPAVRCHTVDVYPHEKLIAQIGPCHSQLEGTPLRGVPPTLGAIFAVRA